MEERGIDRLVVRIDVKKLDEQLERHLNRLWPPKKRQDWEINAANITVRSLVARGNSGSVYRGLYDAREVAGFTLFLSFFFAVLDFEFWLFVANKK